MTAFAKFEYVRSSKLMQAYRKIPCQHCGIDDGTVCGAHANTAAMGKGRGIKATDTACASLCHACHHAVDQGRSMSRTERAKLWANAHIKTVRELVRLQLWPKEVAVPDLGDAQA